MTIGRRTIGAAALGTLAASRARAQQPAEIVIGAPNAMTGGFGEAGQRVVTGLQLAAEKVNAEGGIRALGGARLRVVPVDTGDSPTQATSVTQRLVNQDGAKILVGANTSAMTLSVQIEAERAEIPLLTTSYADQIVGRGLKYTFKIPPLGSTVTALSMQYVSEMFRELKGAPPRRVAFFAGSDSASQSVIRAAPDLARQFNFEIVSSVSFQAGLTDPTPIVSAVLRGRPEVIFLSSFSADVILGTRAIRGVGVTAPVITAGGGISTDTTGAALGAAADNLMGVVCWNWDLPLPGVSQVVEAFRAADPRAPFPPASETLGTGYSIGLIIRDALERAASADPKKVREAIAQGEFAVPMPGGKVAFAENGQNREIVPIMVGWQGGQLRTVWPKAVQAVQPRL